MSLINKTGSFMRKFEIVLSVVLFFAMLISCGLYINVKMNGLSASLPPLSASEKQILLRSDYTEEIEYSDDIIEPLFVGFKRHNEMFASLPKNASSMLLDSAVNDALVKLFSGSGREVTFSSENEKNAFFNEVKNMENYIFLSLYCELPSTMLLPCLVNNYNSYENETIFNVRYLFIIPDENENIYGICVSSAYDVTVITPSENVTFNKIFEEAYDIMSEWSTFKFKENALLHPVLTSSFVTDTYIVEPAPVVFGKDINSEFVNTLFEMFSINSNLVKSFTSGDDSEINYIEEQYEVIINDSGLVTYRANEDNGISLDEYLGVISTTKNNYSLADKIFAVKNIINSLGAYNDTLFTVIGLDYQEDNSLLRVYLKCMIDGCMVTDDKYDAVFEIANDSLTFAEFRMLKCSKTGNLSVCFPQNYADAILNESFDGTYADNSVVCPMFVDSDSESVKKVKWSKMIISLREGA